MVEHPRMSNGISEKSVQLIGVVTNELVHYCQGAPRAEGSEFHDVTPKLLKDVEKFAEYLAQWAENKREELMDPNRSNLASMPSEQSHVARNKKRSNFRFETD